MSEAAPESSAEKPVETSSVPAPAAPSGAGRGVAWLALLLTLLAAAAIAYAVFEGLRRESLLREQMGQLAAVPQAVESQLTALEQRLTALAESTEPLTSRLDALAALEPSLRELQSTATAAQRERYVELEQRLARSIERLEQQIADRDDALSRLQAAVQSQRETLTSLSSDSRSDWQLAEAVYLLRLAEQRLAIAGDGATAQALLIQADGVLMALDDLGLQGLREAVAADLAALRAIPRVDVGGLSARLQALAERIDSITLVQQARLADQQSESWRARLGDGLDAALAHLSEYLVVRRRDVPYEPLMDPQWEGLVRQNLRLLIEQAHFALVAADSRLFRDTLGRADQWLTQLQDADTDELGTLREELQDLSRQSVQPAWPDQLRALPIAEAALNRRAPRG